MFQKFGLRDVFTGLWNRKYKIIIIGIAACVIGAIYTIANIDFNVAVDKDHKERYLKSFTLYIEATEKSENVDMFSQSQKVRNAYLGAYNSEIFSEYLQKNITSVDVADVLLSNPNVVDPNTKIPNEKIRKITNAFFFDPPTDTTTLAISFYCSDDAVGEQIISAFTKYAQTDLKTKINPSLVNEVGRTSFDLKKEAVAQSINVTAIIKSMIKKAAIFAIGFEMVYFIAAFFFMLFNPTINRKSDLDEYDSFPTWEVK